jgi:hypothetical protein
MSQIVPRAPWSASVFTVLNAAAAVVAAALIVPAPSSAAAPAPAPAPARSVKGYKPCSLLTAEEVGKALGAAPAAPKESDAPYGADGKGQDHEGVLSTCTWSAGNRSLLLAVSTDATTKEGKERGLAAKRKSEEELAKRGMKVEKKSWGPVECTVLTPPADVKAPLGVSCRGTKGKLVWYASVSSPKESGAVPADTLKALTDKAAARLP